MMNWKLHKKWTTKSGLEAVIVLEEECEHLAEQLVKINLERRK